MRNNKEIESLKSKNAALSRALADAAAITDELREQNASLINTLQRLAAIAVQY